MNTTTSTNGKNALPAQPSAPVALASIVLGDNVRGKKLVDADVAELKGSIQAVGLLEPLVVALRHDGNYDLIDGYHRFAACKAAGLTVVPVHVVADGSNALRGVVANVVRKDLSSFAIAKLVAEKCGDRVRGRPSKDGEPRKFVEGEEGAPPPEWDFAHACQALGYGEAHLQNLRRAYKKLSPDILAYWEKSPQLTPVRMLFAWASLDSHDEQVKAFEDWQGGAKFDTGRIKKGGAKTKGKGKHARVGRNKAEIKEALEEGGYKAGSGVRTALEWVLGMRKSLE